MTIYLSPWLALGLTLLICGGALWKGGVEERAAAVAVLLSMFGTMALRDYSWPHLQLGAFVCDVGLFVFLLVIALRTEKFWPLSAAGFQLLAVMTHVAKLVDPNLQQWAYMTAQVIWTYLVMIALGVGAWNAWRARRQPAKAEAPAAAGAMRR